MRNPSQLTSPSPVVRQGGLGSLVSFLIMMINVEQVLTMCQVQTGQAREGPPWEGTAQSYCSAPSVSQAVCVVPVRQGADEPQNYQVWRRTEDTARIIHLEGRVSFHPAPSMCVFLLHVEAVSPVIFVVSCFLCTLCHRHPGAASCTRSFWRTVFSVVFKPRPKSPGPLWN